MRRYWYSVTVLAFLAMGCTETAFIDDFSDGVLDPAYEFVVGDASLVEEANGVLQGTYDVDLMIDAIPDEDYGEIEITPGVELSLDAILYASSEVISLYLADDAFDPQDFFSVMIYAELPVCSTGAGTAFLAGTPLTPPVEMSITSDYLGNVTGTLTDAYDTFYCPFSANLESFTLDAGFSMLGGYQPGFAVVDNFEVELE